MKFKYRHMNAVLKKITKDVFFLFTYLEEVLIFIDCQ